MQFVCLDAERRAFAAELPTGRSGALWSRLETLASDLPLTHCWSWSDVCPPQRVLPGDPVRACESARTGDRRLAVRIAASESAKDQPESRVEAVGPLRITAALVEMWREVPHDLLPVATATSGSLSVPRSPGAWRVQAIGGERASSWVDVPTEANSVELTLLASEVLSYRITADGAPLAGARFYLVRTGDGSVRNPLTELLGFASVDGEGRIDLTLPAGERATVVVSSVTRRGAAFLRLDKIPSTIELGPGFTVRGRLVNEAGEPVRARLIGSSQVPDGFGVSQRHQGRSGPDGRFALSGFSRGPATVRSLDGPLGFARSLTLDGSVDLGSVILRAPELVWIRVVDLETGAPVTGARVTDAGGELRVARGRRSGRGVDAARSTHRGYRRSLRAGAVRPSRGSRRIGRGTVRSSSLAGFQGSRVCSLRRMDRRPLSMGG